MKFIDPRPFADPDAAAGKLMELAHAFEPVQDGRIYIEKINGPFLFELKGTPAEDKGRLDRPIANALKRRPELVEFYANRADYRHVVLGWRHYLG
jgi:hypothetical protein